MQLNFISNDVIEKHFLTPWDFGNEILYKLCAENPFHTDDQIIIAKTLFIGRIYAAAIERRKVQGDEINSGDRFYTNTVVDAFRNSDIDAYFNKLSNSVNTDMYLILETHKMLVDLLVSISGLEKRSFASKYLHFHFPDMFFIYDSRALSAMKKYISKVPKQYAEFINNNHFDIEYAKFYCKCHYLQDIIRKKYQKAPEKISTRVIDNMLLR